MLSSNHTTSMTDEQIRKAHAMGLALPSLLPIFTSPPRKSAALQWVANHYTPELRMVAQKIVDNINHVSFDRYLAALKNTVADFNEKVKEPYVLLLSETNSFILEPKYDDKWLAEIALEHGSLSWPEAVMTAENLSAFLVSRPDVNHILVLHGELSDSVSTLLESINSTFFKNYNVYIGSPFLRKADEESTLKFSYNFFKSLCFLKYENIPTLQDIFTKQELAHYRLATQCSLDNTMTLTYFDHIFPEDSFTLEHLRSGSNLAINLAHYLHINSLDTYVKQTLPENFIAPKKYPIIPLNKANLAAILDKNHPVNEEKLEQINNPSTNISYEININIFGCKNSSVIKSGTHGSVYLYKWMGSTVAAKIIIPNMIDTISNLEAEKNNLIRLSSFTEMALPIVKFFGFKAEYQHYCFVTEYMPKGDLFHLYIEGNTNGSNQAINYQESYYRLKKITYALDILHQNGIVHGDLKLDNLLQGNNDEIKFCDFSSVQFSDTDERRCLTSTPGYAAPELYQLEKPTTKSDIYSLGSIIQELFTLKPVFNGLSSEEMRLKTLAGETESLPEECPLKIKRIMEQCRMFSAKNRPSSKEILDELASDLNTISTKLFDRKI